ncbi:MAG: SIS domain-containing protein [Firmicutes bacterium]|nr:SIS domain-containing protein [Bacillota bacterium]
MIYTAEDIKSIVSEIIENRKSEGGIDSLYFVGCGGSLGALYPAKVFMDRESSVLRTGWINSNEFVHSVPKKFGKNSILCVACHQGNTPETVAAAKLGHEMGAAVIILTWKDESPIIEFGDYIVKYSFDPSVDHLGNRIDHGSDKALCALLAAAELLAQTEGYGHLPELYDGRKKITGIIEEAREKLMGRAQAFAEEHAADSFIYTMGSGASWSSAYMESICIFMEMQWLDSSAIHSGEFFHGPFEVTDENTAFMLQVAEGSTRELDERALTFLNKYARRVEVIDAREFGLGAIDASVVDYFNHTFFNSVYSCYNSRLADLRKHPLSTRRYMWKVEY